MYVLLLYEIKYCICDSIVFLVIKYKCQLYIFRFYEALIEEVSADILKVRFDGYTTSEAVSVNDVKFLGIGVKRPHSGDEGK